MKPRSAYLHLLAGLFAVAIPFAGCGLSTQGTAEVSSEVCSLAANCDDQNVCTDDTCSTDGVCAHSAVADGNAPDQAAGDCSNNVCKGGVQTKVFDDNDIPDDKNDCTLDTCNMGVASHTAKMEGAQCTLSGMAGHCTSGMCTVACGANAQGCDDKNPCTTEMCDISAGKCVYTDLNGVPTPDLMPPEKAGDCHVHLCIGGKDTDVVDDTDVDKTPTDCDQDLCNSGMPSNPPLMLGVACKTNGGTVCDGQAKCVECNQPSDCTGLPADDACQTRTCIANTCGQTFAPANTMVPGAQTNGDCKVVECDGAGKQVINADPADLPNDNNACTTDTCNGTTPVNTSLAAGSSCGAIGKCNGAPVNPSCVGCLQATDCQGYVSDDCKQTTCVSNICGTSFTPAGTATVAQTTGDCKTVVCDGTGATKSSVNNNDKPVDGNACTGDVCTAGVPSNPPLAANTVCNGSMFCDGGGTCVQCNNPAQCGGGSICVNTTCNAHVCGTANVPDGTVTVTGQVPNDCKVQECNGAGTTKIVALPGDLPIAANVCQVPGCSGTTPTLTPANAGTACAFGGGKVCDGVSPAGVCVQCVSAAQCVAPNNTCTNFSCACTADPLATTCQGKACGNATNNCGTSVACPNTCVAPNTCGGGGAGPNACGCTADPLATTCQGKACGPATNNCGTVVACTNTCVAPNTCGGGGAGPNACGCTADPPATTCQGKACGSATNNCGTVVACTNTCVAPDTCGGGGAGPNACGCTADLPAITCAGVECGSATNNCGTAVACPNTCGLSVCTVNSCGNPCVGDSDCIAGAYCSKAGVCTAEKGGGFGCNEGTDCKAPGCRECAFMGGSSCPVAGSCP